ncbi:MAG: metallophosphoesterase family protein [Bacillota bacterium]|jgi:exonuclease SbcD
MLDLDNEYYKKSNKRVTGNIRKERWLMLKILHLADLHLGWKPNFLGTQAAKWQSERDQIFTGCVDYAVDPDNRINLVLIVGDLFDNHTPDQALVTAVMSQLQRLVDRGITVVTVPGNHDEFTYPDSVYRQRFREWPGILVREPQPSHVASREINGTPCHIYSLAYIGGLTQTSPAIQQFPRQEAEGWHIAAFHGSLDWDAGDRSLPLSGEALGQAGYDYVALGHIHRPAQHSLARGIAVYPGNLIGKGWHDPGCGQLTVVTLDRDGVQVEKVAFSHPARREFQRLEIDIGRYLSLKELLDALRARIQPEAFVSLQLIGTANFQVQAEQIKEALSRSCFYLEVEDLTETYPPALLDAWARETTLRGYYIRQLRERLAAAKNEREQRLVSRALIHGLKALGGGGE